MMRSEEDAGAVPDDFPKLQCVSRLYSQGGKCYTPYYKAKDVWKWFSEARAPDLRKYFVVDDKL